MAAKRLTRLARYEYQTLTADSASNPQSQKMEYPQITQITQISASGSGRAERTGRAGGVPQVKGCLPAAPPCSREAALHGSDATALPPNEVSISQVAINPQPKSA
jgi:hypothetical protein